MIINNIIVLIPGFLILIFTINNNPTTSKTKLYTKAKYLPSNPLNIKTNGQNQFYKFAIQKFPNKSNYVHYFRTFKSIISSKKTKQGKNKIYSPRFS